MYSKVSISPTCYEKSNSLKFYLLHPSLPLPSTRQRFNCYSKHFSSHSFLSLWQKWDFIWISVSLFRRGTWLESQWKWELGGGDAENRKRERWGKIMLMRQHYKVTSTYFCHKWVVWSSHELLLFSKYLFLKCSFSNCLVTKIVGKSYPMKGWILNSKLFLKSS